MGLNLTVTLIHNDPRLGKFAEDGSIAEWPTLDMDSKTYEHDLRYATIRPVGAGFFVVTGPDRDQHYAEITLDMAAG